MSEDRLSPHGEAPPRDESTEETASPERPPSEEQPSGEKGRPLPQQRLSEERQDFEPGAVVDGASGNIHREKEEPERIPLSIIMSYPTEERRDRLWDHLLIVGLLLAIIITIYLLWAR